MAARQGNGQLWPARVPAHGKCASPFVVLHTSPKAFQEPSISSCSPRLLAVLELYEPRDGDREAIPVRTCDSESRCGQFSILPTDFTKLTRQCGMPGNRLVARNLGYSSLGRH